jgi:hypothetical protein
MAALCAMDKHGGFEIVVVGEVGEKAFKVNTKQFERLHSKCIYDSASRKSTASTACTRTSRLSTTARPI